MRQPLPLAALALAVLLLASPGLGQSTAAESTAAESTAAESSRIYEDYRSWVTRQTTTADSTNTKRSPASIEAYGEALAARGIPPAEIERQLEVIVQQGQTLEVERWNRILTSPKPRFNTEPNAFLAEITRNLEPGRALDVGMGQGRNALYLARQGWRVTGFDPAGEAVEAARQQARELGIDLETQVVRSDQFDFGHDRWDLIVLSYVAVRPLLGELRESLAPGGRVMIEAFHRDATRNASIGGAVVFDTNELLELFAGFRILEYHDVEDTADFGRRQTRLVRLFAQKE